MTDPLLCGDGRCVKFEFQCASDSCPLDRPFLCPDMSCENYLSKCRETLSYRPFKSISVQYNISSSLSQIGIDIDGIEETSTRKTTLFLARSSFEIFFPPENSPFRVNITQNNIFKDLAYLEIVPVAKSQLETALNLINESFTIPIDVKIHIYNLSIPHYLTVRSPVIKVSTKGRLDDNEPFGKPMTVKFFYNKVRLSAIDSLGDSVKVEVDN